MKKNKSPEKLSKFLAYILGRRPDEFGLVLENDGFVKIRELLKVLSEEEGFGYARKSHLEEIVKIVWEPPIEINDNSIRAVSRNLLPETVPVDSETVPTLLYTCIRRRAHAHVLEKGIAPSGYNRVVMTSDKELAEKIGKRIDKTPVMAIINSRQLIDAGVIVLKSGECLFQADYIPVDCFTVPPLPKEKPKKESKEKPAKEKTQHLPGSFILEIQPENGRKKRKDKISRDKDRKRQRKYKEKIRSKP